ncbi:MAG: hypothetical protein R2838_05470 [Caldilineaceae bacterium]
METAAALRKHMRTPGMEATTARYFRDKLAMRVQAQEHGVPVRALSTCSTTTGARLHGGGARAVCAQASGRGRLHGHQEDQQRG